MMVFDEASDADQGVGQSNEVRPSKLLVRQFQEGVGGKDVSETGLAQFSFRSYTPRVRKTSSSIYYSPTVLSALYNPELLMSPSKAAKSSSLLKLFQSSLLAVLVVP